MSKAVVEKLFRTIESNDKKAILACFHEEAVFHNIPMDVAIGHEAIWNAFAPIHDICEGIDWQVKNITEGEGGVIMTERVDRYKVNGKWCEFPVMGTHIVESGKIREWRDYFDMQMIIQQLTEQE